jgi:putative membrane protein insertion efficiency factor
VVSFDKLREWWRRHNPGCDPGCGDPGCGALDCGAIDCGGLDCGGLDCLPDCSLFLLLSLLLRMMAVTVPRRAPRSRTTGPGRAGIAAIRGYQRWLSPHLGTRCRQIPSCSNYGLEAVRRYGLVEGSRLTAARISRCNPSTPRGTVDPVP